MTKALLDPSWMLQLSGFRKLLIGFSGGLDSTVLLHLLASKPSLIARILAVHVHHGLSVNANQWQQHCQVFCSSLGVDFFAQSIELDKRANVEENARLARYGVFSSLLCDEDCLLLAHHQDDQAETVLLQLFRGAGVDGLAAMAEISALGSKPLFRPLLGASRAQLEQYAIEHALSWVEDESNQDVSYTRNFLRHEIMPLLVKQWPSLPTALARTGLHCQQAKRNLEDLAYLDVADLAQPILDLEPLKSLSFERRSNVLRFWLRNNQVALPSAATFKRLVEELIEARLDADALVSWGKVQVRRFKGCLYLQSKMDLLPQRLSALQGQQILWEDFPKPLALNNRLHLLALPSKKGLVVPEKALIEVRFREGGEEMRWCGRSKKLKKLFQNWQIPPWERNQIPLIYVNNQLAAVVGFAVSDLFHAKDEREGGDSGSCLKLAYVLDLVCMT